MFVHALLIATLSVADSLPQDVGPHRHGAGQEEAAVTVHRQPSLPIVSLRLSLLADDPPGHAGAGHLIQHLLYPSMRNRADRVGAKFQMQRTADALVYTLTGPSRELPYLAEILLSALEAPSAPQDAILRSQRILSEERLAEWETAPAHARSFLRAQVFPADLSAAGTDRSAARFHSSSLPAIWAAMYQPDRISVVAVGDVYLGDVQRAFADLPEPLEEPPSGIDQDSVYLGPLAPPQATRAWLGRAYQASDLNPAAVSVAVRLLGDLVRQGLPEAQVDAEHWWTHHGQAAAIIVALPEGNLNTAETVLDSAVDILRGRIAFLDVTEAAAAIRREVLFYARRPDRMAEVIGQFIDRSADANAAERFYARLESLDDRAVRYVLEQLVQREPARVLLHPQSLQVRSR